MNKKKDYYRRVKCCERCDYSKYKEEVDLEECICLEGGEEHVVWNDWVCDRFE